VSPGWLVDALGEPVASARPARWGFRHETWIAEGASGRTAVLQRRVDGSDPTEAGPRAVRERVRAAGLPVPEPVRTIRVAGGVVVILPLVQGTVAAERLGTRLGAALVGRTCGEISDRLGRLDTSALSLPASWATGCELRASTLTHLQTVGTSLSLGTRRWLGLALDRAVPELDAATPQPVHGDLAPVNVLVRNARLVAVLDLDRVQMAHPLYDAAWFAWVVWFHHPDVADAACDAFALVAGRPSRPRADLAWMWPLQLLERMAEAQTEPERAMWQGRLATIMELSPDDPG